MTIKFISSTNIGSRDDDDLRPRIELEYTTENQAIRKMLIDYYSDKPFKDVTRFPAQILRVIEPNEIKKDNYLNNLLSGLPENVKLPDEPMSTVKKLLAFAGFGEKRYKARVLDLDIALPPVKSEGDKNINPLTKIPTNKAEAEVLRDNLLIDYIYTTEFLARRGISCDVGDIVIVSFENRLNRTFGIIEEKLTGAPTSEQTPQAPEQYANPSAADTNTPPPAPEIAMEDPVKVSFFADEDLVPIEIPEQIRKNRQNKSETVYNDSLVRANLNRLDPRMREYALQFINNARKKGYKVVITDSYRTMAQQSDTYAKGRTKDLEGGTVTQVGPGDSPHNFGMAIDFYVLDKNYNLNFNYTPEMHKQNFEAAQIGKAVGLEWGGDWKNFKDRPHLELPGWRKIQQNWKKATNFDRNNLQNVPNYKIPAPANKKTDKPSDLPPQTGVVTVTPDK